MLRFTTILNAWRFVVSIVMPIDLVYIIYDCLHCPVGLCSLVFTDYLRVSWYYYGCQRQVYPELSQRECKMQFFYSEYIISKMIMICQWIIWEDNS